MVSSFPKMQKSSASFSQSIRNRLRLKNLQAQAKNFCRVLDIRVPEIMKAKLRHPRFLTNSHKPLAKNIRAFESPVGPAAYEAFLNVLFFTYALFHVFIFEIQDVLLYLWRDNQLTSIAFIRLQIVDDTPVCARNPLVQLIRLQRVPNLSLRRQEILLKIEIPELKSKNLSPP